MRLSGKRWCGAIAIAKAGAAAVPAAAQIPAERLWLVPASPEHDAQRPTPWIEQRLVGALEHIQSASPADPRLRAIERSLEELRAIPFDDRPLVIVNIPTFELWAWNAGELDRAPGLTMRVIVGRARRTQTPIFSSVMREVVFRPYWNVPRSIAAGEILPAWRKDPRYLIKQQMDIVNDRGELVGPMSAADAAPGLRSDALRVRQRPGPANSLGLVKFVFPNEFGVFMHGTPAQELFRRERRDFSHGCVRLEEPAALAAWALAADGWTRAQVDAATLADTTTAVALSRPIVVGVTYMTAVPGVDGGARIANDIYRRH